MTLEKHIDRDATNRYKEYLELAVDCVRRFTKGKGEMEIRWRIVGCVGIRRGAVKREETVNLTPQIRLEREAKH